MADGDQFDFGFRALSISRLQPGEIVVDLFAGGGGASSALEQALGRPVDIAINHNPLALAMHAANHPFTRHLPEDIWQTDPRRLCVDQRVGWLHASPDCTHFSQAKGGQPRSRATRSLSWVVLRWAGTVRPRIISLENVKEILKWGPLRAKRDQKTGRVMKLDGSIAARGERVPIEQQFLVPDRRKEGRTWSHFTSALRALGYEVEVRRLRACDYGAGTSRERLFLVARCDGAPIHWPEPSHGPASAQPYVTAADCIDWSIPCSSIFDREKPLADATMRRIARGIRRYVLDAAEPFLAGTLIQCANSSASGIADAGSPLGTITAWPKGGSHAVAMPVLVQTGYGERDGQAPRCLDINKPLGVVVAGGVKQAIVTAHLEQANGGFAAEGPGHDARKPLSTITATGSQQRVVCAHLMVNTTGHQGAAADCVIPTITSAGNQLLVQCTLSPEHEAGALRVAAFLMRYHSTGGQDSSLRDPMTMICTRDRLALVTVHVRGLPYVIVDIGLRMLQPSELYRAQGFPSDYIFDRTADGRRISKTAAVAMVGNSVSPPPLRALAAVNLDPILVDATA